MVKYKPTNVMNFQINQPNESEKFSGIPVHFFRNTIFLSPVEISCMEGDGNYTNIYTRSGKKYLVSKTLKNLQHYLNDSFLRIHKSYMINTGHILNIVDHDRIIRMAGGKEVQISRRKSREVSARLNFVRPGQATVA